MCLRPRFIYVASDKTSQWKKQAYRHAINSCGDPALMNRIYPYFRTKVAVPCQECAECLRARQNDLAARVAMAAREYHSMHFLTLTYNEEHVPLFGRIAYVNKVTGETLLDDIPRPLMRLRKHDKRLLPWQTVFHVHSLIEKMPIKKTPRVYQLEMSSSVDSDTTLEWSKYMFITPSLQRSDVQLWLKSSRVAYERAFGEKIQDFKYVLAGEMGPKTNRPHYHILFLGLTDNQIEFLANRWKFGFHQIKKIPELNKDGSNGFVLAAKYVSKYISKGKHECETVQCGYAERPRFCTSRYVGTVLDPTLLPYLRCYDLFGEYDLDTLIVKGTENDLVPKRLSVQDIANLLTEYRKRSIIRYGLNSWSTMPKCIFKKVFQVEFDYFDLKYEKTIKMARRSVVQMAFGSFVEGDILTDFVGKLRKVEGITDSEIDAQVSSFITGQEASAALKDEAGQKDLRSFYAKSVY